MKSALIHVGRGLLALYFLLPGIMKFAQWDMHIALMETHGMVMVPALLALAGVTQIGASICLFLNKQVVICALGLAAMVLLINLNLHDFWNIYEGVDTQHETQNFFKNMGIFAGLLLLAAINMGQEGAEK
ncbi:MAG: DoxX family membrane protein [Porticoccaceae bacterium]|nr:DoxX family membrane protein [Porticoccaceae bacterium]|tara:strand:+ start:13038 stop:13427 length:390 start_codon:yes stop_codon:yes gene_type:complete